MENLDWILPFTEIDFEEDGDAVVGNAELKKYWCDYQLMVMLAIFNIDGRKSCDFNHGMDSPSLR